MSAAASLLGCVPERARTPLAVLGGGAALVTARRVQLRAWRPSDPRAALANRGVALRAGELDAAGAAAQVLDAPRGGPQTYVRRWDAPRAPRGTVLLVHGFSWHSAYFAPLAARLRRDGFDVVAYDLQGHGLSGSVDAGLRGYAHAFDDWVEQLARVAAAAPRAPAATKPLLLFGESLGGALLLRTLIARRLTATAPLAGVVLSAPVVRVAPEVLPPPPVVAAVKALATLLPRLQMPAQELDATYDAAFGDAAVAKASRADPLVVFDAPRLATAAGILGTTAANAAALERFSPPALLVLHGSADGRTAPANSEELVRRAACADKTLRILPGGRHQLLQDTPAITRQVMDEVAAWMAARAPA
jgi:acylglycerol lipase